MSRYDSPKIHRIPARSEEGRRLIRTGAVVNHPPSYGQPDERTPSVSTWKETADSASHELIGESRGS